MDDKGNETTAAQRRLALAKAFAARTGERQVVIETLDDGADQVRER